MRALLSLAMLVSCGALAAAPRVAVVYSGWPKGAAAFAHEYDGPLQQLGWPFRSFRNTESAALVAALPETDIVVAASVSNYEDTVDFAAQRDDWLAFLKRGGVLLITDASYDSVLAKWVGGFGEDFALTTATCIAHSEKTPESQICTYGDQSLLRIPNDLPSRLAKRTNWAHLASWAPAWESLATCADGKSVMVMRQVGKGLVVVTSHFAFRSKSDVAVARAILENLAAYRTQAAAGVVLTQVSMPPWLPGDASVRVGVRNLEKEARNVVATRTVTGSKGTKVESRSAIIPPEGTATLVLPHADPGRGPVKVGLRVVAEPGGEVLDWSSSGEIPPVVGVQVRRPHLAGRNQNLVLQIGLLPEAQDAAGPFELALRIDGGKEERTACDPAGHQWVRGVQDLADGKHQAWLQAFANGRLIGEAEATFTCRPEARVAFRSDRVVLVDGKPFLPIGFYHVSQAYSPEHRLQMVRDVAAAGFNTVHTRILDLERYGPFLDECERLGVKVITEFSVSPDQVIPRYRNHPAVLGWNPGDEPAGNGVSPEEMFARYDHFKQLDPDHLAYTVICQPAQYAAYARGTDVLAPDPYPVPNQSVASVYDLLRSAAWSARAQDTALWAVPQCFGGYGGWKRPPTPNELRTMTYLELLAGARGFILYTYGDGNFAVRDHKDLWLAAGELARELRELAPFVLFSKRTSETARNGYYSMVWWVEDEARMVLVNTNSEPVAFFSTALPAGDATVVAGTVEGLRRSADGQWRGVLPPLDRAVLAFRSPPQAVEP